MLWTKIDDAGKWSTETRKEKANLKIVCLKGEKMMIGVEVYSTRLDFWKTIEAGFQFKVLWTTNDAIVNGNPCWIAETGENHSVKSELGFKKSELGLVLVRFDVKKMEFKMVPLLPLKLEEGAEVPLVDWKGSLGAIVYSKNEHRVESVDVWVFDDCEMIWRLNNTFGPIEMKVDRCLQCSKNGKIIGECLDGKLFLFDPETGCAKVIEIDEACKHSSEIYGYSESLAYIKGMEPVVVKKDEEEDDLMAGSSGVVYYPLGF